MREEDEVTKCTWFLALDGVPRAMLVRSYYTVFIIIITISITMLKYKEQVT